MTITKSQSSSIVLIGMPGAGKSTLGVLLAKALAKPFVDTDLLIQEYAGMTLQDYLDHHGYLALRALEEKILVETPFNNAVISTGGSAVYSEQGMKALSKIGVCVYIKISLATLMQRVTNQGERGLACAPGVTLEDLYNERYPLYERYADVILTTDGEGFEQSLQRLEAVIHK